VPKASLTKTSQSARHLLRQRRVVLLLAAVEAAVLEHDELARADLDAVDPVGLQRAPAAQQLAEARGDRRERVGRLGLALVGRPRCEVTITAAPAASAISIAGSEARMRVSSVIGRRRPAAR
jgi:hypothetical protein